VVAVLVLVGVAIAVFVGVNIGGSSTGAAFGPSVGTSILTKFVAGILMAGFVLVGGWTVGRNVVQTMGGRIVPKNQFSLVASVAILFFVGVALLVSNVGGVPASTSMTAVGAIAGLGAATGSLRWGVVVGIATWWIVAPIFAFVVAAAFGCYGYPLLDRWFDVDRREKPLVCVRWEASRPVVRYTSGTKRQVAVGGCAILMGCYMAFSAGASNVANAVAPLVGAGALNTNYGILVAAGAIGVGALTVARRTLETIGNDLGELPLVAALIVEVISASVITVLSSMGIPASLAVTTTVSIIGLNWGRQHRHRLSSSSFVPRAPDRASDDDLLDTETTWRIVALWVLTPTLAALASFALFSVPLGPK
jgi:PiT family inorganic phosphate transporter